MNCICLIDWLRYASRAALLASLAGLASYASAADASNPPSRSASRYATKQVRISPEPAPVQKKVAPAANYPTRQVAHAATVARRAPAGYRTAARGRFDQSVMVQEGEVIMEGSAMMPEQLPPPGGEIIMEDGATLNYPQGHDGDFMGGDCADGSCGPSCGPCGRGNNCCLIPCPNLSFDKFEFFAGADGFTGPLNRGEGGSFGFHEGVNWGSPVPCSEFLSMQIGGQAIQSTFSGSDITDEDRRQFFVTAGLFRRVDWGLQGGVVIDFMHDEWYYEAIDPTQLRAELSWVFPRGHELGVWATHGINNATGESTIQTSPTTSITLTEGWRSTDIYAAFYRRQFAECGASGRIFAGITDSSDGLVGADFNVPISESWAVRSDFAFLIPTEGRQQAGNVDESWNLSIGLVWYPGCRTARSKDYHRPLFNVANNGSFFVEPDAE